MVETMAPGFVTPQRGVQIPPVVSIVGTGRPLSEGIQLHHNRDKFGFFLNKEIEGFGLAPFENTTQARASGGATLRHRRTPEGSMFLPLTLVSPNPSSMYDMMAWLVDTVTGQDGFFDVVYFDPYSQEARRRTVLYDSGLETVNEQIPDFKHIVGVTGTFLSPFWRGPERVVVERIAPPVKPLITADPGSPVNRWDDTGFSDTVAYEPWFVVDGGLEKQGTGAEHGRFVAGHRVAVNPGETVSVSAGLSYVDGPNVGAVQVRVRAYNADGALVSGSEQTVIAESYAGSYTGKYVVPATGVELELGFYTASDVHANTRARIDNLDVKRGIQYLARYEWEGEPHESPSIKFDHTGQVVAWNPLSGVDWVFDKIWRQPTPPPAGTHYAWLGEPDASPSVRLDGDGNETAHNHFTQPRDFAITNSDRAAAVDMSTPGRIEVLASNYLNAYDWGINSGINYIGDPDFAEGEYERTYTMSTEVKAHVQHPEGYYNLRFDLRAPASHYSEGGRVEDTGGEWVRVSTTLTLGADLQGNRSLFNFTSGANHTQGDVIEYRNWKLERGSAATPYFDGSTESDRAHDIWYNAEGVPHEWVNGQGWVVLNDPGFGPVPDGFMALPIDFGFDGDSPDEVDEGSLEGAYSFPFFPVFLADSTVQGEHDLTVEGDAPVWPVWEIVGPGKDVEIIGPDGSRLFVEGEVSTPIRIVTEPGKRSIRDASGLIWERMKPGDDQFFALEPGEQVVKMTMVGGNPESTIKAVYSENWKTPRGTAQGMIRGDVV